MAPRGSRSAGPGAAGWPSPGRRRRCRRSRARAAAASSSDRRPSTLAALRDLCSATTASAKQLGREVARRGCSPSRGPVPWRSRRPAPSRAAAWAPLVRAVSVSTTTVAGPWGVRARLVGGEGVAAEHACPRRRRGPGARRRRAAPARRRRRWTPRGPRHRRRGVRRPRRPRPRSPRPTRISSGDLIVPPVGHLGDLAGLAGEADRGQQRRELAAVGRRDALAAGRGAQALGGAHDADHDDVGLGLLGGALAQRVAGHLDRLLRRLRRMAVVAL